MTQNTSDTDVGSKVFDYVIIGGGTAGLVLAARLTENPDVQVAVLEAGENRLDVSQIWT
jgi:choline dehydrogenase